MSYDTAQFYNSALPAIAGCGIAALVFALLPPLAELAVLAISAAVPALAALAAMAARGGSKASPKAIDASPSPSASAAGALGAGGVGTQGGRLQAAPLPVREEEAEVGAHEGEKRREHQSRRLLPVRVRNTDSRLARSLAKCRTG